MWNLSNKSTKIILLKPTTIWQLNFYLSTKRFYLRAIILFKHSLSFKVQLCAKVSVQSKTVDSVDSKRCCVGCLGHGLDLPPGSQPNLQPIQRLRSTLDIDSHLMGSTNTDRRHLESIWYLFFAKRRYLPFTLYFMSKILNFKRISPTFYSQIICNAVLSHQEYF